MAFESRDDFRRPRRNSDSKDEWGNEGRDRDRGGRDRDRGNDRGGRDRDRGGRDSRGGDRGGFRDRSPRMDRNSGGPGGNSGRIENFEKPLLELLKEISEKLDILINKE